MRKYTETIKKNILLLLKSSCENQININENDMNASEQLNQDFYNNQNKFLKIMSWTYDCNKEKLL